MAGNTEKLGRLLADLDRRVGDLETYPQLRYSSVDNFGVPVLDADGNIVARLGKQTDGTWGAPPLAGPVPTEPKGISAIGTAGGVEIEWQGATVSGTLPLDFDAVEILADDAIVGAIHNGAGGRTFVPLSAGPHRITARTRTSVPVYSAAVAVGTVEIAPPATVLAEQLAEGLATASRSNTVSATTPGLADGYPEGAVWTRVESVDGALVAADRWMIVDGAWAPVGLDASTLVTGTVDAGLIDVVALAAALVTSGLIRTGATGQRVEMTSEGLTLVGVDPDGQEYPMIRIGPNGSTVIDTGAARIDDSGAVIGTLGAFDQLTVGGRSLASIIDPTPRGTIATMRRATSTPMKTQLSRVIEVYATLWPGRRYEVKLSSMTVNREVTTAVQEIDVSIAEGTRAAVQAGTAMTEVQNKQVVIPPGAYEAATGDITYGFSSPDKSISSPTEYVFTARYWSASNTQVLASWTNLLTLSVTDTGPALPQTGAIWDDKPAASGGTQTAPTQTVRSYTWSQASTGAKSYRGGSPTGDSEVIQGSYDGTSANNRSGLWTWSNLPDLTGATISEVTISITNVWTYASSGGEFRLAVHGATSPPATLGGADLSSLGIATAVKRGEVVTYTLPSSLYAGFVSGRYRGIGVQASGTSRSQYSRFKPTAYMTIRYTK